MGRLRLQLSQPQASRICLYDRFATWYLFFMRKQWQHMSAVVVLVFLLLLITPRTTTGFWPILDSRVSQQITDSHLSLLSNEGRERNFIQRLQVEDNCDEQFYWENQWFPVIPTSYLNGADSSKPVSVDVLGRNLVIWKSSDDDWSVFEDICPHRRSPLSTGKVSDGCLTCRYHGWEFDGNGQVTKFPMRPPDLDAQDTPTVRANGFLSQSAGGLLWVFLRTLNDAQNVPLLPREIIPTINETTGAEWMFNRNPISYISMMENTVRLLSEKRFP